MLIGQRVGKSALVHKHECRRRCALCIRLWLRVAVCSMNCELYFQLTSIWFSLHSNYSTMQSAVSAHIVTAVCLLRICFSTADDFWRIFFLFFFFVCVQVVCVRFHSIHLHCYDDFIIYIFFISVAFYYSIVSIGVALFFHRAHFYWAFPLSIGGTFALFDFRPSMTMSGNELCRRACGATQSCHTALLGTCVCVCVCAFAVYFAPGGYVGGGQLLAASWRQTNKSTLARLYCLLKYCGIIFSDQRW